MRFTIKLSLLLVLFGIHSSNCLNCTAFWQNYKDKIPGAKNLNTYTSSSVTVAGISSSICRGSPTCCSSDTEKELKALSKTDYENAMKNVLTTLSKMLKTKSVEFNDFFKELLTKSKKDFHEMFKRTYGILYEQNSYIFTDFFGELEAYYTHGKTNLAEVMDHFFTVLYQKMFTVIQRQYKFDEKYLVCISEHMSELKPFGDVPQRLALPLKRSFIATRAYAQSLGKASEVVTNLIHLEPTEQCTEAVLRMLHCPSCSGITNSKVCIDYCVNVMKGCSAYHTELDASWVKFIEAMSNLERRLVGSFNIELVVESINVKISDGIMNFQENSGQVSTKLFKGCGIPPLIQRRRKRQSTDEDEETDYAEPRSIQLNGSSSRTNEYENDGDANDYDDDDEEEEEEDDDNINGGNAGDDIEDAKQPAVAASDNNAEQQSKASVTNNESKSDVNAGDSNNKNLNNADKSTVGRANNDGNGFKNGKDKKKLIGGRNDYNLEQYNPSAVYGFLKLIKEIDAEIANTKHFWKKLPAQTCSQEVPVENNRNATCWNGTAIASYDLSVVSDGKKHQQWNPEVPVDVRKKSSLLNEQIFALKTVTSHLHNAYQGMDVNWIDTDDLDESASGSGYGRVFEEDDVDNNNNKKTRTDDDDDDDDDDDEDDEEGNSRRGDEDNEGEYGSGDHSISPTTNNNNNNGDDHSSTNGNHRGLPAVVINENATLVPVLYTQLPNFVSSSTTPAAPTTSDTNNNNNNNRTTRVRIDDNVYFAHPKENIAVNNSFVTSLSNGTSSTSTSTTTTTTKPTRVINVNDVEGIPDLGNSVRNTTSRVDTGSNNGGSGTSVGRRFTEISIDRAIASYLLPAVVMWIGGSFNDWFNSLI